MSKNKTPMPLLAACLPLLALAACASAPAVPPGLVPAGETTVGRVAARGVQIYECRAKAGATGAEWAFVGPEAELLDASGAPVGKHYAGPHWEDRDGSKIVGTVKARADAPAAGAVPWLLLTTRSVGGSGRLAKVTSIQRVNTVGGVAPTGGCDAGTLGRSARVPYTADYVLFAA
jgi:hypothetical protein